MTTRTEFNPVYLDGAIYTDPENGRPVIQSPDVAGKWIYVDEQGGEPEIFNPEEQRERWYQTLDGGDARHYLDSVNEVLGTKIDWDQYAESVYNDVALPASGGNGWSWTAGVVAAYYIMEAAAKDHPELTQALPTREQLDQAGIATESARKNREAEDDAWSMETAMTAIGMAVTLVTAGAGAGAFGPQAQALTNSLTGIQGGAVKGAFTSFLTSGGDIGATLKGAVTGGATGAISGALEGGGTGETFLEGELGGVGEGGGTVDEGGGSGGGGGGGSGTGFDFSKFTVKDWVSFAASGIGIATGLASLLSDDDEAYREAAKTALEKQTAIADTMAGISKEQWDLYKKNVVPLLQNLSSMTTTTDRTAEDMAKAAAQTKGAYGTARQNLERAVSATRNPGDPGYGALLAPSYMDEATAVSKAMENARVAERTRVENFGFDRTQKAVAAWTGQALPGNAANNNAGAGAIDARVANANIVAAADVSKRATEGAYGGLRLAADVGKWFESVPGTPAAPASDPNWGPSWRNSIDNPGAGNPMDPRTFENVYPRFKDGGAIRRPGYAEGGKVEGPGTGTSDSIKTEKRPGTYILSTDTVRAVGTKKLDDLMEKAGVRKGFNGADPQAGGIPVRLSTGEYEIPPEVTQHYGEEFFNKLQQKYHRPIASDQGYANGGAIRKRVLPRLVDDAIVNHYCGGGPVKRR